MMQELGAEKVFVDKASGKNVNRPQLNEMLAFARQGDTIVVESISRFARNTKDLLELMEKLTAKGVGFISKKEAIDTGTPTGKFMLTVFAAVAELEREYILQRQREGIAVAKQAGKYKGRKPIDRAGLQPVLEEYHKGLLTATQAMRKWESAGARSIGCWLLGDMCLGRLNRYVRHIFYIFYRSVTGHDS